MIDLSTTEEEKGRYVTAVHLKEDSSNYVVTYADVTIKNTHENAKRF